MLEFLIPIFYPEKITRVTVMVVNTIFGALLGERRVDWRIVLQAVVAKLVEGALWEHENRVLIRVVGKYAK